MFWLAYCNGANDNFKGVATIYGSNTTSFRSALIWATVTTIAGSFVSLIAAHGLIKAFSGKGLVPDELLGTPELLLSVGVGAAITIFIATLIGMPTSTTHALAGTLAGIAYAAGPSIPWAPLMNTFLVPLLLSPLIAIVIAGIAYYFLNRFRKMTGLQRKTCLCLENGEVEPVRVQPGGEMLVCSTGAQVHVDDYEQCIQRYDGHMAGVRVQSMVDGLHYMSAGAVCFSRAVNDTPKIAALLLAASALSAQWALIIVAVGMGVGGWLQSYKVAETMSKRITTMSPGQGVTANLATAFLVLVASRMGVPVSTTHVSCGTIFGIGIVNRSGQLKTIAGILFT
ncbi:inorganic phosphate transporter, partial [bacterium]|nr:inorganic phosphate transporter [bacterium]